MIHGTGNGMTHSTRALAWAVLGAVCDAYREAKYIASWARIFRGRA